MNYKVALVLLLVLLLVSMLMTPRWWEMMENDKVGQLPGELVTVRSDSDDKVDKMSKKIIDVPYINQNDVVCGCEAVSSTMLLQYFGYRISEGDFTDKYLIRRDWHIGEDGRMYGPDPNAAFPGDPYILSGANCGFGSYAPSTAKSIDMILDKNKHMTKVITGNNLTELSEKYIDNDIPVLIWATMDMRSPQKVCTWIIDYTDENSKLRKGDQFTWISGEHCLVLVGYDEDKYYFNDPYRNHGLVGYDKSLVESRFEELGKQSLVILKKTQI